MASNAKESASIRTLKDRLQLLLPAFFFTQQDAADGSKLLVSNTALAAAGDQVIAIRIHKLSTDFTDVLGLVQPIWAPLAMQVIEEHAILSLANRAIIEMELAKLGIREERYENTAGVAVTLSEFQANGTVATASHIVDVSPDFEHPLAGQ